MIDLMLAPSSWVTPCSSGDSIVPGATGVSPVLMARCGWMASVPSNEDVVVRRSLAPRPPGTLCIGAGACAETWRPRWRTGRRDDPSSPARGLAFANEGEVASPPGVTRLDEAGRAGIFDAVAAALAGRGAEGWRRAIEVFMVFLALA